MQDLSSYLEDTSYSLDGSSNRHNRDDAYDDDFLDQADDYERETDELIAQLIKRSPSIVNLINSAIPEADGNDANAYGEDFDDPVDFPEHEKSQIADSKNKPIDQVEIIDEINSYGDDFDDTKEVLDQNRASVVSTTHSINDVGDERNTYADDFDDVKESHIKKTTIENFRSDSIEHGEVVDETNQMNDYGDEFEDAKAIREAEDIEEDIVSVPRGIESIQAHPVIEDEYGEDFCCISPVKPVAEVPVLVIPITYVAPSVVISGDLSSKFDEYDDWLDEIYNDDTESPLAITNNDGATSAAEHVNALANVLAVRDDDNSSPVKTAAAREEISDPNTNKTITNVAQISQDRDSLVVPVLPDDMISGLSATTTAEPRPGTDFAMVRSVDSVIANGSRDDVTLATLDSNESAKKRRLSADSLRSRVLEARTVPGNTSITNKAASSPANISTASFLTDIPGTSDSKHSASAQGSQQKASIPRARSAGTVRVSVPTPSSAEVGQSILLSKQRPASASKIRPSSAPRSTRESRPASPHRPQSAGRSRASHQTQSSVVLHTHTASKFWPFLHTSTETAHTNPADTKLISSKVVTVLCRLLDMLRGKVMSCMCFM